MRRVPIENCPSIYDFRYMLKGRSTEQARTGRCRSAVGFRRRCQPLLPRYSRHWGLGRVVCHLRSQYLHRQEHD